ncbi:MAG: hypothetical protein Q9170_004760 [Blastenia crenularia]
MTVNVAPKDKIWQIHLKGLLALLKSSRRPLTPCSGKSNAMRNESIPSAMDASQGHASTEATTIILIYNLQSRLYQLAPDMDRMFHNGITPRKLDVQKTSTAVKNFHKDLSITHCILARKQPKLPVGSSSRSQISRENNHLSILLATLHTALILTSTFLLQSGAYLDSTHTWSTGRIYQSLNHTIRDALHAISTIITPLKARASIIDALETIWPLYAAQRAPGISNSQRRFFNDALVEVGKRGVPKAAALVRMLYLYSGRVWF